MAWAALDDRLEAGAAQPVDRLAGDLDRQPGEERGHAADVAVVLARLVRRAEDDVVDRRGVDPGALDERADDVRRQVVGPHVLQRAAVAAERRAQPVDDDGRAGWIAAHGPMVRRWTPVLPPPGVHIVGRQA